MRSSSFFCTLLIAGTLLSGQGRTQSALETVQRGKRATALVEVKSAGRFGTAFCIAETGFFVTAAHVVEKVAANEKITLVLNTGEKNQRLLHATVMRTDKTADLALLKTERGGLTALEIGSSEGLIETTPVTAFGYPFGTDLAANQNEYPAITVSAGRVTALRKAAGLLKSIQLDASLNPGNSGGPVLDGKGQVIGVVASGVPGSGVNFAVPADHLSLFLSKPEITFEPPLILVAKQSELHEFRFQLITLLKPPQKLEVTFSLDEPGQPTRQVTAQAIGGNVYAAKVIPVSPRKGVRLVKFTLPTEPTPTTLYTHDQDVTIGKESVKLSAIGRIENRDGKTTVTLAIGKRLVGSVTGLNAVKTTLGDAPAILDLSRVAMLKVEAAEPLPDFLSYTITVRQNGQVVETRDGTLLIAGGPSATLPQKTTLHGGAVLGVPVFNPRNGHWYRSVLVPDDTTWTEANRVAQTLTYRGRRGHLATITSAEENQFLTEKFLEAMAAGCWLGGFQDRQASDYREPDGGWRWVTGERWEYSNWNRGLYQEPNDGLGGNEDFLGFTGNGRWNDLPDVRTDRMRGYIVEYER